MSPVPTNINFQKVADFLASDEKELAINGSAGTGKTYLLNELYKNNYFPLDTLFTATTNKASNVLATIMDRSVITIFKALNLTPFDNYDTGKTELKQTDEVTFDNSLIIIDEAYMLTAPVLAYLRTASPRTKIIFIGDSYQLPPVFYKNSPITHEVANVITLTKIRRTDKPAIQAISKQLRDNVDTHTFGKLLRDNNVVTAVSSIEFINQITDAFITDPENTKIVAWTNERVINYNRYINNLLHNQEDFAVGDKIIVNKPILSNESKKVIYPVDAEAYITDISETIVSINTAGRVLEMAAYQMTLNHSVLIYLPKHPSKVKEILKHFKKQKDWGNFFKIKNYFADIRHPYACTVHKSQGSTYKTIFIDVSNISKNNKKDELAKLMYVAVTRASHKIVMCLDTANIEKEAQMLNLLSKST